MYAELMETYGDKDLALAAAQAVSDELLARFSERARPVRAVLRLPRRRAQVIALVNG